MRSLWLKVPRFLLWRLLKRSSFECSEGIALKRLRKKKHALLRKSRRINPYLGCCGFWWGSTGSVQTQLDHHGPLSPGQTRLLVPSLVPVKGANLSCFVNNFKGLSNKLLDGLEIFLCSVRLLLQSVKSHEYLFHTSGNLGLLRLVIHTSFLILTSSLISLVRFLGWSCRGPHYYWPSCHWAHHWASAGYTLQVQTHKGGAQGHSRPWRGSTDGHHLGYRQRPHGGPAGAPHCHRHSFQTVVLRDESERGARNGWG